MRLKVAVLVIAVVTISATVGASAFTTGTVSRSANVNVVSDDVGLIALADGTSGHLVGQSGDKLTIDFTNGSASGANVDATFELGDSTDPTNHTAFNITNQDAESHDLTISYTGATESDSTANIKFRVYDSTGAEVATVTDESTSATVTGVSSGATLYVVVEIDTNGLSSSDDLSGTLDISA